MKALDEDAPMNSNEMLGIFRIDKQEYLEKLLNGKLRFTSVEKYKMSEDKESHRNDLMEGLKRVSQDAGYKGLIPFDLGNGAVIEIRPFIQVKVAGALPNVSVLCFSTVNRIDIPSLEEFHNYKMDPRMFAFGNKALVIKDMKQFIDRFLAKAKEMSLTPDNGSVEYIDGDRYEGFIKRIGFAKLKDPFEYQKEYRLALRFNDKAPKEYTLDIGSIRDIAEIKQLG
ncbi:MAG TPA: hypothetical protein VMU88_01230 [bacterium]|nr:hypothetical protein [bacterium]